MPSHAIGCFCNRHQRYSFKVMWLGFKPTPCVDFSIQIPLSSEWPPILHLRDQIEPGSTSDSILNEHQGPFYRSFPQTVFQVHPLEAIEDSRLARARSVAPAPVQEYRNYVSHQYEAPYEQVPRRTLRLGNIFHFPATTIFSLHDSCSFVWSAIIIIC